jgi:hypothetical protein
MGGEGFVLKERWSIYRPGIRTPTWLKLKPKLTLEIVVTGGSGEADGVGRLGRGRDARVRVREHPRSGASVHIR